MDTKVSVLSYSDLSKIKNIDALVIPVDKMLSVRGTKLGKEVNELEGSDLSTRLRNIRRSFTANTGSITIPESTCIPIKPYKISSSLILATVSPNVVNGMNREDKVRGLYRSYLNIFLQAVQSNCKKIVIPVLGLGNKAYDSTIVMFALISSIVDFIRTSSELLEICIIARGSEEKDVIKLFDSVSVSFGLDVWYIRSSFNMQDYGLDAITFKL